MNRMLLAAAVSAALVSFADEPTLPGGVTLSEYTLSDRAFDSKGYVTPAHLRYPYVSTYYVKPIVLEGESVKVGYYVTDWNHSKARFRDDSARFDVTLRLTCGDGKWIERAAKNVKTGDGEVEVGALPKGTWHLGVTAYDRKAKLPSHTVWQEFRVEARDFWSVPAEKIYRVTAKDLADYGIRGGDDVERIVPVDVSKDKTFAPDSGALNWNTGDAAALKHVDDYLAAHPHVDDAARPGYAVYVAADAKGVPISRAFARLRVVYDKGYDREAMARQALTNSVGITRLLADKAAAGFRKIVFVKDTYRVSHLKTISLPDRTVVDFAGATLKMNGFTGCRAEQVTLPAVTDTVFENCIVEGDYYEHDYAKSENKSEWVHGWRISSCCRYCAVRNVTSRNIVGYGAINGIGTEGPGKWLTYCDSEKGNGLNARKLDEKSGWEPGGLRLDGTFDAADKYRFTSKNLPLDNVLPWGWLQVAKLLGYRGIRTRNWPYTVAYYDAAGKFLSAEIGFQYRVSRIPEGAKTARISIEVGSKEAADACDMALFLLKIPVNCVIRGCRFERCRAVGYSLESSRNFLMTGCDFSHSGECLATCAFDAEDGGDEAQDFFFRRNVFHDNPHNEFLTCSGLNFVVEDNVCHICFYPRTHSPCARRNTCKSASFGCRNRNRTGYWRYADNVFREKFVLGGSKEAPSDWFNVIEGLSFPQEGADVSKLTVSGGATGLFRDCAFKGVGVSVGNAENCTFRDTPHRWTGWQWHGAWKNCRAEGGCVFLPNSTNFFENCAFKDFTIQANQGGCFLDKCLFENAGFPPEVRKDMVGILKDCTFKGKCVFPPCFKDRPPQVKK